MTNLLRFLMLLALGLWLGAILCFGVIVAPTLFATLPTRDLAGAVVSAALAKLHMVGFICGGVFLLALLAYRALKGKVSLAFLQVLLVIVMLACTAYSEFGVGRRMNALKNNMGVIDNVPHEDPRRVAFNHLHKYSEDLEYAVFGCGLVTLLLASRRVS